MRYVRCWAKKIKIQIKIQKQNSEAAHMFRQGLTDQRAMEVETDCESDLSDCAVIDEDGDGIEHCDSDESTVKSRV